MLLPVAVSEELHNLRSIRWAGGVGLANWDPKALTLVVIVFGTPRDPQNSNSLKRSCGKFGLGFCLILFFFCLGNEI